MWMQFASINRRKLPLNRVDALAQWATVARQFATNFGKKKFYITGEVTGGNTFGSLY
jgi:hypothetical protein